MKASQPWLTLRCDEQVGGYHAEYDLALCHDWTVIFGPSGSGKSTLLRLIAGLLPQRGGELLVHGAPMRKTPEYVPGLIEDFGLARLRSAMPQQLSGGERQRVAIARALGSVPRVLLLDEVFTGMDAPLRTGITEALHRHRARVSMPIVSVTHDVGEAFATAQEVLLMDTGRIIAQGPPAQVLEKARTDLLLHLTG